MRQWQLITYLLLAGTSLLGSACSNACVALSETICECEPTQAAQQSCIQRVSNESSNQQPTQKELARCESLLDECTCEKLAEGRLEACGLSNEAPVP